jgi:hypothetical protein
MHLAAHRRTVARVAVALLYLFGSIGPIWMLAARAADPLADVGICSARIAYGGAGSDTAPAHQPPLGGMCPHCQWCHATPITPANAPPGIVAPRVVRVAARIPAASSPPHTSQPRAVSARGPPILT